MGTEDEELIKDEARFWARVIICPCCPDAPMDRERIDYAAEAIEDCLIKIWDIATATEAKKHEKPFEYDPEDRGWNPCSNNDYGP